MKDEQIQTIFDFADSIGLPMSSRPGVCGFLPAMAIQGGELVVDPDVANAGDVLHEMAHLAILPSHWRAQAEGDIDRITSKMLDAAAGMNPDSLEYRAIIQAGEAEAIAWSWAAGVHLGFAPQEIITDAGFKSGAAGLRQRLLARSHFGINGLAHAGFTNVREGVYAQMNGLPVFPKLVRWLQI